MRSPDFYTYAKRTARAVVLATGVAIVTAGGNAPLTEGSNPLPPSSETSDNSGFTPKHSPALRAKLDEFKARGNERAAQRNNLTQVIEAQMRDDKAAQEANMTPGGSEDIRLFIKQPLPTHTNTEENQISPVFDGVEAHSSHTETPIFSAAEGLSSGE